MSSLLLALALAIALLGGAIYGATRFLKLLVPSSLKETQWGMALIAAIPICLGALLGALALESLTHALAVLTEHDTDLELGRIAGAVIGMFSGSFAAQIHSLVTSRIKRIKEE